MSTLTSDEMRKCEFCGCKTNARQRFCCDKGRDADKARQLTSKERSLEQAEALLQRCQDAMCNWFSNEFDGGAAFSALTGDIPMYLKRPAPETPAVPFGASSHRFAIECEGCKRGVTITLGQGVVLGYQCSCGHYTKLRDAEKAFAGRSGIQGPGDEDQNSRPAPSEKALHEQFPVQGGDVVPPSQPKPYKPL